MSGWVADLIARNDRREWSKLPPSFEMDKVRFTYAELRPHFPRNAVTARIAASKATTFQELRAAVERAGL